MLLGSIGSNGSGQGWSSHVEELAEHLVADFDGSLSVLAASDLATAVASYNMRQVFFLKQDNKLSNIINCHETLATS